MRPVCVVGGTGRTAVTAAPAHQVARQPGPTRSGIEATIATRSSALDAEREQTRGEPLDERGGLAPGGLLPAALHRVVVGVLVRRVLDPVEEHVDEGPRALVDHHGVDGHPFRSLTPAGALTSRVERAQSWTALVIATHRVIHSRSSASRRPAGALGVLDRPVGVEHHPDDHPVAGAVLVEPGVVDQGVEAAAQPAAHVAGSSSYRFHSIGASS